MPQFKTIITLNHKLTLVRIQDVDSKTAIWQWINAFGEKRKKKTVWQRTGYINEYFLFETTLIGGHVLGRN